MLALLLTLQIAPADLIAKLGHDDPDVREAATAELIKLGRPAADIVRPLLKSDDPEVSARAYWILDAVDPPPVPKAPDQSRTETHCVASVDRFYFNHDEIDHFFFDVDESDPNLNY